jgi:phosphodiesterase/alkaline phosphatase D-like protein
MRLKITCLALLACVAACLGMAAVASAASSPTATATKATAVTNTSARMNATINPEGSKTSYVFSYGPTSSLGTNTTVKTVASGTKAVLVSAPLTHLATGTTYYYALTATNASGTAVTKTVMFKTTGHAPTQAFTGGPDILSTTSALLTGSVDTQGVDTEYYFEYGITTAYGTQTTPATVTGSSSSQTVSYTLTGLTPGVTYYYQLVAVNGPNDVSMGGEGTFTTWPDPAPAAKLVQFTTPHSAVHGPYILSTIGKVSDPSTTVPGALACSGDATVSFYYGKRLLSRTNMAIAPNCFFSAKTEFETLPVSGLKSEKLTVYVRFNGNHYVKGAILKPETITLG